MVKNISVYSPLVNGIRVNFFKSILTSIYVLFGFSHFFLLVTNLHEQLFSYRPIIGVDWTCSTISNKCIISTINLLMLVLNALKYTHFIISFLVLSNIISTSVSTTVILLCVIDYNWSKHGIIKILF